MSSGLKRPYRVTDFLRADGNGKVVTSVMKLAHPHRMQRVTLIPVPHYAKLEYYNDWVYQPYIKDHILVLAPELHHPYRTYLPQFLMWRGAFPGYGVYQTLKMKDPVDVDMTRAKFMGRTKYWWLNPVTFFAFPQRYRDVRHPWIRRSVQGMLGTRYLSHPAEDEQSFVVLVPATQAHTVVNSMSELGFQVDDTADVEIGDKKALDQLAMAGDLGEGFWLAYLYWLIVFFFVGSYDVINKEYRKWMREQIINEGHDPAEFGY